MSIKQEALGKLQEQQVYAYTLTNSNGVAVRIMNYGGIITHIFLPSIHGSTVNIVAGFNTLEAYTNENYMQACPYFGALIGRYANRIKDGAFTVNGEQVQVSRNQEGNSLHGGFKGFDKVIWDSYTEANKDAEALHLQYISPHGEEGFPGALDVQVTYQLNEANELTMHARALNQSGPPTPVSLTNHSYFNLTGFHRPADTHELIINARSVLKSNNGIPNGEYLAIENLPAYNFRNLTPIASNMKKQRKKEQGFDDNYVLEKSDEQLSFAAGLNDAYNQRSMLLFTNQPGLQLYTANGLDGSFTGSQGVPYHAMDAVCLEPQLFPDTPNHQGFGKSFLHKGETYEHISVYKFLI